MREQIKQSMGTGSINVDEEINKKLEREAEEKFTEGKVEKKVSISEKITKNLKNIFSKGSN